MQIHSLIAIVVSLAIAGPAVAETARPPLTGIDHVVFKTSDQAAAEGFYGRLLGLAVIRDPQAAGALTIRVNNRQRILIEPGLPPSTDERLSHVAITTTDLAALAAYLKEKGVAVEGPSRQVPCGREAIRVIDPDGHTIEFVAEGEVAISGGVADRALSARLLHAGVTVRNEAAANAFYHDVLGMAEIWRGGFEPSKTNWVNVRLPEGADYLEYMLRDAPSTRRQLGVDHHVCLVVPDIQAAWEQVRARTPQAARAKLQPPQIGRNEKWQINLYDPDGTRVELMEPFNVR
jgi:catechol 2,3-dioxygenase-like lactoylglutathione lyase family enzyme